MKNISKNLLRMLLLLVLTAGIFAVPSLAKETTRIIQTRDFTAFSEAAAQIIKEGGSAVQSNGRRDVSAYASRRLIVKSLQGAIDLGEYGAETIIQGPSGYYVMQFATQKETAECQKKLEQRADIAYAEADGLDSVGEVEISEEETVENAGAASSSHLSWGVEHIEADEYAAYLKKTGSDTGITIAVVDSGVWNGHTMLSGCTTAGYDYVDNDANPFNDGHGHGTHVAGTIVDSMSTLKVTIMAVRVLADDGYGSHLNVGNGIRYAADHGAKVINVSIGGGHSEYKDEAVQYAISKGAVVVVAAGNDATNVKYSCPGHMQEGLVVAAIDENDRQTWFSNYGNSVDVCAPGEAILSCSITGKNAYVKMSGTSMAAPHVSAAAAMYRLRYPTVGPVKVQELVKRYCKDLGTAGWDTVYGNGVLKMTQGLPETAIAKTSLGTATAVGTSQVKVTWKKVSEAHGYRVYRKVPGGGWVRLKTISGNSATSYTDQSVEPGKKYTYTVRAYQKSGAEMILGDFDMTGLTVITGLDTPVLKSAQGTGYNSIKVTWMPVKNAMGYRLYRKETSSGTWKLVGKITRQSSSYLVDQTAVTGVTYYYTVRATCAYDGTIKASAYQNPGVQGKAVLGDTAITAIGNSAGGIKVTWSKVAGATGYTIYRSTSASAGFTKVKTITDSGIAAWTDNSVISGTRYYYKLRAYLYMNQKYTYSAFTPVRQITVQSTSGGTYTQQYEQLLRKCKQQFLYKSENSAELLRESQEEKKVWEKEIQSLNEAVEKKIGAARYLLYDASYQRWISQRDAKAAQKAAGYTGTTYQWKCAMSQIQSIQDRCEWIIKTYLS